MWGKEKTARLKVIRSKQQGFGYYETVDCTEQLEKERLGERSMMKECRGLECKVVRTRYTVVLEAGETGEQSGRVVLR